EGTVTVPEFLSKGDLEDMLDAISEAATGSLAGLCDFSYRYLGQDVVAFAGSVADMLSEEDSEVQEVVDRAEVIALLRAQYGIAEFEAVHALDAMADDYAKSGAIVECALPIAGTARQLRCPSHPEPCSYVRVVIDGLELAYWNQDEWQEAPADVIGAIMGAAMGMRTDTE
ncbi:MAG: hypothetical protein K8L99_15495, partial [Anaerolineae bacterium]|nr:hypothetical protein [Anaerolineae bacterium]